MIIPNGPTDNIDHIYGQKVPPSGEGVPSSKGAEWGKRRSDEVSLSEVAQQLQRLRKVLDGLPEIRQEKVAKLKQQLSQGTYRIDEEGVARSLLIAR